MNLDEYQEAAERTAPRTLDAYPRAVREAVAALRTRGESGVELLQLEDVHTWAHGLAGEAGEVCDLLKKVHGHGKAYEPEKLLKELGDVLWYLAVLAGVHGFKLSEVAKANVEKLRARYPTGFSVAAAEAKADEVPAVPISPPPAFLVCAACGDRVTTDPSCDFCWSCCKGERCKPVTP